MTAKTVGYVLYTCSMNVI